MGYVAEKLHDNIQVTVPGMDVQSIHSCLAEIDQLITSDAPIVASYVCAEKDRNESTAEFTKSEKSGIVEAVMNIIGIRDLQSTSMDAPLSDLGLDSLATVEISQSFERNLNISMNGDEVRNLTFEQIFDLTRQKC